MSDHKLSVVLIPKGFDERNLQLQFPDSKIVILDSVFEKNPKVSPEIALKSWLKSTYQKEKFERVLIIGKDSYSDKTTVKNDNLGPVLDSYYADLDANPNTKEADVVRLPVKNSAELSSIFANPDNFWLSHWLKSGHNAALIESLKIASSNLKIEKQSDGSFSYVLGKLVLGTVNWQTPPVFLNEGILLPLPFGMVATGITKRDDDFIVGTEMLPAGRRRRTYIYIPQKTYDEYSDKSKMVARDFSNISNKIGFLTTPEVMPLLSSDSQTFSVYSIQPHEISAMETPVSIGPVRLGRALKNLFATDKKESEEKKTESARSPSPFSFGDKVVLGAKFCILIDDYFGSEADIIYQVWSKVEEAQKAIPAIAKPFVTFDVIIPSANGYEFAIEGANLNISLDEIRDVLDKALSGHYSLKLIDGVRKCFDVVEPDFDSVIIKGIAVLTSGDRAEEISHQPRYKKVKWFFGTDLPPLDRTSEISILKNRLINVYRIKPEEAGAIAETLVPFLPPEKSLELEAGKRIKKAWDWVFARVVVASIASGDIKKEMLAKVKEDFREQFKNFANGKMTRTDVRLILAGYALLPADLVQELTPELKKLSEEFSKDERLQEIGLEIIAAFGLMAQFGKNVTISSYYGPVQKNGTHRVVSASSTRTDECGVAVYNKTIANPLGTKIEDVKKCYRSHYAAEAAVLMLKYGNDSQRISALKFLKTVRLDDFSNRQLQESIQSVTTWLLNIGWNKKEVIELMDSWFIGHE